MNLFPFLSFIFFPVYKLSWFFLQATPSFLVFFVPVLAAVLFLLWTRFSSKNTSALGFGKQGLKASSSQEKKTTFADVAGYDEAKLELKEVVHFLAHAKTYLKVGARVPKGVLLVGPPGTGKTLLARAVSGEAGVPFFSVSGASFVEMYVGLGAARVRDLFQQAKAHAPCIVFIDELDALGRSRSGHDMKNPHEEREQTLQQLLIEMDGFQSSSQVIVIAATNRPEVLDPALMRAGRFDRQIVIDFPVVSEREEILKAHAKRLPLQEGISFATMAQQTTGFSGADLENLVNEAGLLATRRQDSTVLSSDFSCALDRILMGSEQKAKTFSWEEKQTSAYEQCGKALATLLLTSKQTGAYASLRKLSIIPRNRPSKEAFWNESLRRQTQHSGQSRAQIEDQIAVLLSGRAASELWLKLAFTTTAFDLQQATQLARNLVTQYGLSKSLGLQAFSANQTFLGSSGSPTLPVSDQTLHRIEKEVSHILSECFQKAWIALHPYEAQIKQAVDELILNETMELDRFEMLMGMAH